jgi:hypothetical protein
MDDGSRLYLGRFLLRSAQRSDSARADMPKNATDVAIGGKADWPIAVQMSAFDPKRTLSAFEG